MCIRDRYEHFLVARDEDARSVADLDHAHRLELLERLANARLPDLEALRHLDDGRKTIAAPIVPTLDRPANLPGQLVGEALLHDRLEMLHSLGSRGVIRLRSSCSCRHVPATRAHRRPTVVPMPRQLSGGPR